MKPLYTIGYQRLAVARLVDIVRELKAVLVDVRAMPRSRNPAYSRTNLEAVFGEQYVWMGNSLGGFGRTTNEGIDWVKHERKRTPLLLMCMEDDPRDCHRHLTICGPHFPDAIHIHGGRQILACDLEFPDSLF